MSQRGKRGNHLHHPRLDVEPQPPPTKRRKGRPPNGGGGGLGGGLGGGGSGGGPGNNINFSNNTQQNVNCIRPLVSSSTTSVDLESNQQHASSSAAAGVAGDEIISSTSAKAAGSQGSSSSVATWQARSVSDIKMSSIYNRSSTEAPAELYRKDLISAMKLPDSEQLANYEYLIVNDQWKQEWERGVQVPVNPDSLPEPYVEVLTEPIVPPAHDFKLPKNRFLRITKDDNYSPELHFLTNVVALAENSCAYDIDQVDEAWLKLYNADRKQYGAFPISETQFERVIEELEIRCWEQIQVILKNEEGLGIEYDENVICDVCRSPDSEEANEMVFCDNCNICVHQACYGITAIPSGQWLCRTCSMGIKPDCVLCPNKGGAMKSTKSGKHWAHVSCALWIPEVSIGCVDRMEPITKISSIPTSRWALLCVLCRGRDGACIQCSVKTCKTAYHVTCAFQHGLEMRAIIEEGNAEDGVKLRSYCHKHSVSKGKKEANSKGAVSSSSTSCKNRLGAGIGSGTEDDDCRRRKSRKSDMTSEERNQVRARRLQEVESEFDKHVNIKDISCHLFDVDDEAVEAIYNYWKLKRKSRNNRALIPPKSEDVEMIARKQEQQDLENHKLVVHLRQDLERVRNLCYMVSRREKLSRSLFKLREQVFYKQISVLSDANAQSSSGEPNEKCDEQFKNAVIYANDGPTLYDRFYSSADKNTPTQYQSLEYILEKLLGSAKNGPKAGSKASRASTSPTKRATNKSTAASTSALTSANSSSYSASSKPSTTTNKKVNNGGVVSSKSSSLIAATTNENNDKQLAKKSTNSRRSNTSASAAPPPPTTPTSGQRTSTGRTSSKTTTATATTSAASKTTKNAPNSSDDSSSSSGSSSSDDEDSSSENGSSSGSGSSSDSESASSSSDSDSSSLSDKANSPRTNKNLKKISPTKKKVNARSIENTSSSATAAAKQRRKSFIQTKTETETKTSAATATSNKSAKDVEITTVLSSSSELEAEANNKKKQKVSVPDKQANSSNTSETEAGVTTKLTSSQNAANLLLSQTVTTNKTSQAQATSKEKDNCSSSSDESIEEVTPKKSGRKQLTKSIEGVTRRKLNETSANRKVIEQIYSDSDSSSELDDNKDKEERAAESNVSDSQNQQTIRTKAAMKEFTLQQQTCSKTQNTTAGVNLDKSKDLSANSHKLTNDLHPPKPLKLSSDLLVVPQRQAAKKASENMRSTNSNTSGTGNASLSTFSNTSNTTSLQRDADSKHRETTKQKESVNSKSDEKSEKKTSLSKSNEQQNDKPIVSKRGRPPKNLKESADPSQQTPLTANSEQSTPTRTKELQSPAEQHEPKKTTTSLTPPQTSEEKSTPNKLTPAVVSDSSKSNEITKNNILVAYVVPQRQAAKKAAEQLKNSNKPLQSNAETNVATATNVVDTDKEKERSNSSNEKEAKLKTPEDRKAVPMRRISTREVTNSASKQEASTAIATAAAKKTQTNSRQRSKDEPPAPTPITTTPKRGAQPLDKKRKVSVTSSSESDSSSSSSSSDGSDDSSSNSGSSYTSSSSDEDASDVEEKSREESSVSHAAKQNVTKSLDSRTMVSQQVSSRDTKISPKLPSPKQLKRNISNSSNSTDDQSSNKSSILTRRKSYLLEEQQLMQKTADSKTTNESQVEDNTTSIPQPLYPSPIQTPAPATNISTTLHKQSSNEEEDEPKNENKDVEKKIDDTNIDKESSPVKERTEVDLSKTPLSTKATSDVPNEPEISTKPVEGKDIKNKTNTTNDLQDNSRSNEIDVNLKDADKEHSAEDNTKKSLDIKETSETPSKIDSIVATHSENKPTSQHNEDVCSEVPMDIDEELTTAPTHTSIPSADNSALLKSDELLVNLEPPAAPMPASPSSSSSSSCEENDDQSNASNEDQEQNESTRASKSRRTIPSSPPILAEEEHTHHTQHLLNEMELIKALEEERKKEQLAASQAQEDKFTESKSSDVAVIGPEPLEIIDLDSNSNSEHAATPPKQQLDVPTTLQLEAAKLEISSLAFGKSALDSNKNQQNLDSLQQESNLHSSPAVLSTTSPSTPKVSCDTLPLSPQSSVLESGHHPIVDTILDLEDNAKKKQEESQQQQIHSFPNVLLNTSPFRSHVLDPHQESLNNLLASDKTEEDSFQATRNLLEKLRKKRNRTDESKEPDLMLPPPTPAIPSVFPFHNAADPEDIIHAQKENAALSLETNSAGHYNLDSSQSSQNTQQQTTNNHNLLVGSSPTVTSNKDNNLNIYGNISRNNSADTVRSNTDTDNICSLSLSTYIDGNAQSMQATPHSQQTQQQLPISPMQPHSAQHTPTSHHPHQGTTPNSNYSQQQQPHTPAQQQQTNVADLSSLIQNELANQTTSAALNKTPTMDAFGPKQNNMSSNEVATDRVPGATPDFVDLHAAAAASKDFTSSASIGSNKLVVDCDFDENTRMQSPYTMQANRIWNENDLIAARRSTSPSSVSESNDQAPSIDLQPQQQQQTPVQHQIPLQQAPHVQAQQHANVLNSGNSGGNNSNTINKNSFFSSINNFTLTSPFQQHSLQTQNQLSQQTQQSSITNGIDSMMYNQGYNSSTATTPTSQGTPQQQQQQQQSSVQQQARTQQYNGSVSLFHDATSSLPNMNQIPFVSNDGSSGTGANVMYPAGPGIGTNVNTGNNTNNQQTRPDLYNSNSGIGNTNTAGVPYSGAAFTSSTHNIALTAAIVGSGNLIDHTSPRHPQMRPSHQFNLTSPNNANTSTTFNSMHLGSCAESMMSNPQPSSHHTTPTKDSPSKANRSSSRYNQQTQQQQQLRSTHKSPQVAQHKSPGKSPRQMELLNKHLQQQQQQQHSNLTDYPSLSSKPTKYDPMTHTLAGKPRQRAPRGTGSGTRGRGRGRGRSRGGSVPNPLIPLTIPMSEYVSGDNLVGTPFEFSYEEEMATPGMENLQSLRDRRRSFDCRNAQNTDALKYRSPSYNAGTCKVRHSAAGSTGSSVTSVTPSSTATDSIVNCNNNLKNTTSNLHSIVQPMLPGPVDMRTYNLGFEPQHSSASQEAYNNNLLGAFDSGTADQTLSEFDEEDEREFQSALRATGTSTSKQLQMSSLTSSITNTATMGSTNAVDSLANNSGNTNLQIQTYSETLSTSTTTAGISAAHTLTSGNVDIKTTSVAASGAIKTCQQTTTLTTTTMSSAELVTDLQTSMETTSEDVSIDSDTTLTTKASLSDARNQLKLKIKGPLAYPDNYNSSNAITHTSTTVQSNISNVQSMASTNATISASVSGSGTNSRRMRKKELLSLYVVQKDNHGDDSSCGLPSTDSNILSNALETTRKPESVCSEVDEYGSEFNAGSSSSKRFKKNSSRELRSLDIMVGDMNDTTGINPGADGRRRSGCSSGSAENSVAKIGAASSAGKRRGRSKTLEGAEDEPAPKLKIKIRGLAEGNVSATATVGSCETSFNNYEVSRRSVACPPKKRLTSNYTPTLEDLMRDSMNYRDQVMQEFGGDDDERTKRSTGYNNTSSLLSDPPTYTKKAKSSKSKKEKKDKKRHKNKDFDESLGSINAAKINNSMTTTLIEQPTSASPGEPPKLILRINKRKAESTATDTSRSSPATANTALSPEGPSAPIRLKLARVAEGGGYVIGDKKRKKSKKSSLVAHTEDLANANSNTSCSNAITTLVSINDMDKFNEDANARLGMSTSPPTATFTNYAGGDVVSVAEPPSMAETVSDIAKDSSTPSPCLVIDSSKSNDIHDSSNTASSLNDITAPCISESIHSMAVTPTAAMVQRNCNDNSNSQSSSALSSHSRLSHSQNSNSMLSVTHQSQNSTGNNSNSNNTNNQINHPPHTNTTNNSSNSNSSNSNSGNNSGSSSILGLQKNCEVR